MKTFFYIHIWNEISNLMRKVLKSLFWESILVTFCPPKFLKWGTLKALGKKLEEILFFHAPLTLIFS